MICEINFFGLYISPILPCAAAGWAAAYFLRRYLQRRGFDARIWHPALFELSTIVIFAAIFLWGIRLFVAAQNLGLNA